MAFLAGDRIIASLLDKVVLRSQFRFSLLYNGGQKYDILIMGNSRGVNTFYAPAVQEATGKTTLNLSYNGMSADVAEALFMDYLDRNEKPKLLILEVSNVTHNIELLKELKLYATRSERLTNLFRKNNPNVAFWIEASHVFQFNDEMFLRALYYYQQSDQTWINRYTINPALLQSIQLGRPEKLTALPENVAALRRIVNTAKIQHIGIRMVVGPYLPAYGSRLANLHGWAEEVERAVASDIPVWDYSTAVKDTTAFADRLHLNYQGSLVLLKELLRDGLFEEPTPYPALESPTTQARRRAYRG